jgi:hypothetical protein
MSLPPGSITDKGLYLYFSSSIGNTGWFIPALIELTVVNRVKNDDQSRILFSGFRNLTLSLEAQKKWRTVSEEFMINAVCRSYTLVSPLHPYLYALDLYSSCRCSEKVIKLKRYVNKKCFVLTGDESHSRRAENIDLFSSDDGNTCFVWLPYLKIIYNPSCKFLFRNLNGLLFFV